MTKSIYILSCLVICILILESSNLYSQTVSSNELINKAEFFDKKVVVYEGEIIGELMCRKDGCWINVNDGGYAIGVWIPMEIKFTPHYLGSYKYRGDWIRVEGIFNRNCKEHLGEFDIHAQKIELIKEGEIIYHPVNRSKVILSLFIWGLLCIVLIWMRLKRK